MPPWRDGEGESLIGEDGTVSLECRCGCAGRRRRIECPAILSDALKHEMLTRQGELLIPAAERGRGGGVAVPDKDRMDAWKEGI